MREQERQRIARELHDDVSQQLAVLAMDLEALEADLPRSGRAGARLRAVRKRLVRMADDVHRVAYALDSPVLTHAGFEAALRDLLHDFGRRTRLRVSCLVRGRPVVAVETGRMLFRVVQEALQNVAKHARASRVVVRLTGSTRGIRVVIEDDGVGFDPERVSRTGRGLGLVSIGERLQTLDGTVSIRSRPGQGTRVEVRVPVFRATGSAGAPRGPA